MNSHQWIFLCLIAVCTCKTCQASKRLLTWLCLEFCNDSKAKIGLDLEEIRKHANIITAVSFEKYTLGPNSTLVDNNLTEVSSHITKLGLEAWPLLSSFPHPPEFIDWMRFAFKNPDNFIDACISEAKKFGYHGYNLDWEPTDEVNVEDSIAYADFIDLFAKRLHMEGLQLSVDVATWSPIWNYTFIAATEVDYVISMGTYTSTDSSFSKQLSLIVENFGDRAGVGLETVNASTELRIPLDEVQWRMNEIEKSGAQEIDIWRMPVPSLWWPMLEKYVNGV